jgi:predicted Zn-dependent protease with MMP-like domain
MAYHVSKSQFARLVETALEELPDEFARALDEMTLEIRDRPTAEQLKELGLEEDELLLGLYVGVPLTERSTSDSGRLPDKILIFKEDCEIACDSEAELVREVRTTVLHELGHYFGMDEDELGEVGYG